MSWATLLQRFSLNSVRLTSELNCSEKTTQTAQSYYSLGVTQNELGDFTSALQSHQRALDIRVKLFGEEQAVTAKSYDAPGLMTT